MKALLKSSAQEPIVFGPIILTSDHISAGTGLTLTVTLSKNGGAFASPAGAINEIGNGWYYLAGNATDTNTLGSLVVHATATGADPFDEKFEVVAFNLQDAIRLGLTSLPSVSFNTAGGLGAMVALAGTAAGGGSASITLATSPTTNLYQRAKITIVSGTGAGQTMNIASHTGTALNTDQFWIVAPDATSVYVIYYEYNPSPNTGGQVPIQPTLSLSMFDANSAPVVAGRCIVGSGTTTPVALASAVWYPVGIMNGKWNYSSKNVGATLWWSGTAWIISATAGSMGTWNYTSNGDEAGPTWTVGGTATGTLTTTSIGFPTTPNWQKSVVSSAGAVTVGTNNDKTGYALTGGEHTNIAADTQTGLTAQGATPARMGYIDNINVGGAVATHADIVSFNSAVSKHCILKTVGIFARPDSGTINYQIQLQTFNATTNALVDADSTPALTATGIISGSLAGNLSVATHFATGTYLWNYAVAYNATIEQLRFNSSPTIASSTFPCDAFAQVLEDATVDWNTTSASQLTAIYNKLPVNNIADETLLLSALATLLTAVGSPAQAGALTTVANALGTDVASILASVGLTAKSTELATAEAAIISSIAAASENVINPIEPN